MYIPVGCAPGTYQTMTEEVRVIQGKAFKESYPTARECPIGAFSDKVGSTSCRRCPLYLTNDEPGSDSQEKCYGEH